MLRVAGSVDSDDTDYTVDVFANAACDPSGFGEARTFLGQFTASNGGSGLSTFTEIVPGGAAGNAIASAATNTAFNTSELSRCITAAAPAAVATSTGGTTVTTEGGAGDSFDVVLSGQPTSDVAVTLTPSVANLVTLSTTTLTFTPANWNVPQTVNVASIDDQTANGTVQFTIGFTLASADSFFNGAASPPLAGRPHRQRRRVDRGHPTSGLVTTESGGTATFTVRLATVPTAVVTVALTSSNTAEGTVSPTSLTFQPNATALNPQTVTVTGVDDGIVDGNVAYFIITQPGQAPIRRSTARSPPTSR